MAQALDATYWTRESAHYWRPHPRLRVMAKILTRLPQRRLLDLGCSGAALRDLLPSSFTYFGCDITDQASKRLPDAHFLQRDFNESADLSFFVGRRIDVMHVGGVLEYLRAPEQLLSEARKLVPAGAALVLSIINFEGAYYSDLRRQHAGWIYQPGLDTLRRTLGTTGWAVERAWPFSEKRGLKELWSRSWAKLLGPDHPWTRRRARQFILLARAA
jgi:predicted TPR repeat methyltransferase